MRLGRVSRTAYEQDVSRHVSLRRSLLSSQLEELWLQAGRESLSSSLGYSGLVCFTRSKS